MGAKVWIADNQWDAEYTVYFVDYEWDEKNAELIANGELVQNQWDANVKVFIVQNQWDAKILITRNKFPK